ncbi:MFS transporter [Haloarchaeobius sp. HME9146]|uniref:MFS transporter n=1 Tax=Haloarchaeobius sp. HME9146 TaxID=2978732 RepID=UPI0021BE2D58|nr:MFS transporter [Haloarchaeobius sp. HME9146]
MTTRRDRIVLASVVFVVLLAQVLLYPGIDTLVAVFDGGTALQAGMWFLAAEFAAFVAFAGVWGAASDAAGRRVPFVVAGTIGGGLGYALLAVVPAVTTVPFWAVLVLRVLQGAATIGAFSLAMTMLMDLDGGHGRNMGAAGIAIGSGTALGAPLGGQLYELSPLAPVAAASVLMFGVAVLATVALTDRRVGPLANESASTIWRAVAGVRETPILLVPYVFGFIDRLTAGFFALVGTLYFRDVFELSPGATGLMLALFFAPFALLQYPFGIASDRYGRVIPVVAGSVLYGVAIVAVGLAPTVQLAGAAMVAVGVVGALMSPATMALVTDFARDTERGVAMAGFNAFGSTGFLAGILVGGTVASRFGYEAAFLTAGGVEILIAAVTVPVFIRLRTRRERPAAAGR